MSKIYNDFSGETRIGNIELFLEAVIDNFLNIEKSRKRYNSLMTISKTIKNPFTSESVDFKGEEIFSLISNIQKKSIQGIVMLNTFYEALINEIGCSCLGQRYYRDNLDRLNLKSKWEVVLKLTYDKTLNKGTTYFENFSNLIKARNKLIHYKSSIVSDDLNSLRFEYDEVLKSNVLTIGSLIDELKVIDKEKGVLSFYDIDEQLKRVVFKDLSE
ncbi:hypothetical protein JM658_14865 [Joostella atrarenae]|uniref:RiboL-PSP-HEPN domain-containing protein n=1 Tax=Joostella atrarenae TaxID=679257 RepID=A0ABS9J6R3_9FLAO|nr:hypothetical protein [Joostella atrarenae]MCF8716112.1 hypothetical protein [Joostella atrarenae]